MAKYLKNRVFITLPGTGKKQVKVPVKAKPLRRKISFTRTREDVAHGVQGECATCANAVGASRNGLAELVQFTDSRVYLVDRFDKHGVPTECTVGEHDQGDFQREFDTNKKALMRSDMCEGVVTIRPLDMKRHQNRAANKPQGAGNGPTDRQVKRERGAAARAQRAGIIYIPSKRA
jgi:hypothetical protein